MIRKVFILGKVRGIDTSKDADNTEMTEELKNDLKEFIHKDIEAKVEVVDENRIKVCIFASYNGKVEHGDIPIPITWLITGECESFRLEYPIPVFTYYSEIDNQIRLRSFTDVYEKNAIHYGATSFKKVTIVPNSLFTSMIIDY